MSRAVDAQRRPPTSMPRRGVLVAVLLAVAFAVDAAAPARGLAVPEQGFGGAAPRAPGLATAGAASVASLADIDALVFANRYEQAETAYTARAARLPDDAATHAAHAVFLLYTGALPAGLSEARRAVALAGDDGHAHAALCRALDWNASFPQAVAEGRHAVQLAPDDPLAHLYLSEALADSGDAKGSQAEIDAASRLITQASPPYLRAELHREAANLAKDRGDQLAQVDALSAAEREQPSWVERVSELAVALFLDDSVDRGHAELEKALGLRGHDVGMLLSLGSNALLAADYADARTAYTRAGQLAPLNVDVLHGQAQVAMAGDDQPDAAAGLLASALRVAPADTAAAAYLLYIARDVWRDEPRGLRMIADAVASGDDSRPSARHAVPPDVDAVMATHAHLALDRVNAVRKQAGLPAVTLDDRLTASAAAHSFYWLFNQARTSQKGLGIHTETPGTAGFSGAGVYDRDSTFGWRDGPVGEDITHRGGPVAAVNDWVDSVYHRFPILRPDLRVIGFADAGIASLPIEDMEFGFTGPRGVHATPVVYPADGQTSVPAAFYDNELPDPVPAGASRVTGYPVTVTFDRNSAARLTSFTLTAAGGAAVQPVYTLPPGDATENSASLLTAAPLTPGARYTAHIVAIVDGAAYDRTWTFTVSSPPS
ncbi:MAG TPA: CAP domain-containing protein [Candidatus Dormibacteraeota bacterium]|jgi:tetratricopeptide (TPR) repeat protein|nr:CAP domain-containing protein [Candidatus Dormibacteraeota bacterium]